MSTQLSLTPEATFRARPMADDRLTFADRLAKISEPRHVEDLSDRPSYLDSILRTR